MDQLMQCPVCTLYLHNGISMESHLDTHPKDQVIKALCKVTGNGAGYESRTSSPIHSERSFKSRSRTPATDDNSCSRWNGSHREHDRHWRKTPSRTLKTPQIPRYSTTPFESRLNEGVFETSNSNNCQFPLKIDKVQQSYPSHPPLTEFDQQYVFYPEQQEEREIKYSRSSEYNAIDTSKNIFAYNLPTVAPALKIQTSLLPNVPRKCNDFVKILPKSSNIVVKTNMGGVQYIAPGVKPVHVMVPTTPSFMQKNVQNNMIMNGLPSNQLLDTKTLTPQLPTTQFNQVSGSFTPGTTVVTQNSQIIYREMVHNIDGKPFISNVPVIGAENVTNVAQTSSVYQNVMVVDQYGNASCMYAAPQQIIPKACSSSVFNDATSSQINKSTSVNTSEQSKTLVFEVGPIISAVCETSNANSTVSSQTDIISKIDRAIEKCDIKNDLPGTSKGLKILSNIKVEVPVQHHKSMLNTIVDLTKSNEPDSFDIENNNQSLSNDDVLPSSSNESTHLHTFSVIKNVGNPPSYKESTSKSSTVDAKIDNESSNSCPVPDLICTEKPSISPCSELSEQGDNSTDRNLLSPKPESSKTLMVSICQTAKASEINTIDVLPPVPIRTMRNNALRLNNIFVKKHKKVLQIKNAKSLTVTTPSCSTSGLDSIPSLSTCLSPQNFSINKMHSTEKNSILHTVSVERLTENNEFDADTEEQSMDIEPIASSSNIKQSVNSFNLDDKCNIRVKEEILTSNDGAFSNEASTSDHHPSSLQTVHPVNIVVAHRNLAPDFDDESNHRELLELEATSKNKQLVNMINENYFGDNLYGDYFTPDKVESFEDREPFPRDLSKDGMYLWGEPSQKESEFVLPNFIHESYKIAENRLDYTDMGHGYDRCERDSKADVLSESRSEGEAPLIICADECMPLQGEISGQESNGDMVSPWTGMYTEVTPSEPYDLIARESWISDGSDIDSNEKQENLDEDISLKTRLFTCSLCGTKLTSMKELRAHKSLAHARPTGSGLKATYSRLLTSRTVKLEEKPDTLLAGNLLGLPDSKEAIASTMLQVYDAMNEAKPKLEALIKQEPKRRRKDYVCETCKVDQVTETAFKDHLKIHPLECMTCGKCFFRRNNLALHMKMHLGIKNYKCEVCEKRFLTRQKLTEHHNIHTGRAPVKCTQCDATFRRYSNMVQHRNRHHLNKKAKVRDFVCHCGLVFHSVAKLRWHKETHDDKPKACPYCSDKFVHSSSLTRHVRRSHDDYYVSDTNRGKPENVPCPVCKQVYLKSNLRAHLQTHSGKRSHLCVICNKAFTTKWNLKLHRWTHMSRSAKPYKCSLCKGAFVRQTEYISHMKAHKSIRPYTCNYCGCQFIRKINCQRHVREHEMPKKYVCKVPECGKAFHRSYYLSEHMKVHSGARPFSCGICGKTSSNKSNHNKHVKIHHAREPIATEA